MVELKVEGETFVLEPDDVLVDSKSAQGFAFAENDGMLVALDTRIDRDLLLEGLAREVVRAVQDARKQAGLDVSDRIVLRMRAQGDNEEALTVWRDYILAETLARVAGPDFRASFETASAEGVSIELAKADP